MIHREAVDKYFEAGGWAMSMRNNWDKHLGALITMRFFNDALARDFWSDDEDLWEVGAEVPWRWAKLYFVYFMSGVVQILVPSLLIGAAYLAFINGDFRLLLGGSMIAAGFAALGATILASLSCIEVARSRRGGR